MKFHSGSSYSVNDFQIYIGSIYRQKLGRTSTVGLSNTEKERYLLLAGQAYARFINEYASGTGTHEWSIESGWTLLVTAYRDLAWLERKSWNKRKNYSEEGLNSARALLAAYPNPTSSGTNYYPYVVQNMIGDFVSLLGVKIENNAVIEYYPDILKQAVSEYDKYLNNYGISDDRKVFGYNSKATCLWQAGEYLAAIETYQKMYELNNTTYKAVALHNQGECHISLKQYKDAQDKFILLLNNHPGTNWANSGLERLKSILAVSIKSSEGGIITGRQSINLTASIVYPDEQPAQIDAALTWNWQIEGETPPGASLTYNGNEAVYTPDPEKTQVTILSKVTFDAGATDKQTVFPITLIEDKILFAEEGVRIYTGHVNDVELIDTKGYVIYIPDDGLFTLELVNPSGDLKFKLFAPEGAEITEPGGTTKHEVLISRKSESVSNPGDYKIQIVNVAKQKRMIKIKADLIQTAESEKEVWGGWYWPNANKINGVDQKNLYDVEPENFPHPVKKYCDWIGDQSLLEYINKPAIVGQAIALDGYRIPELPYIFNGNIIYGVMGLKDSGFCDGVARAGIFHYPPQKDTSVLLSPTGQGIPQSFTVEEQQGLLALLYGASTEMLKGENDRLNQPDEKEYDVGAYDFHRILKSSLHTERLPIIVDFLHFGFEYSKKIPRIEFVCLVSYSARFVSDELDPYVFHITNDMVLTKHAENSLEDYRLEYTLRYSPIKSTSSTPTEYIMKYSNPGEQLYKGWMPLEKRHPDFIMYYDNEAKKRGYLFNAKTGNWLPRKPKFPINSEYVEQICIMGGAIYHE